MFSKEEDRGLQICKIHHKRKSDICGKIKIFRKTLNIMLAILMIGAGMTTLSEGMSEDSDSGINSNSTISSSQLVMLDVTYDHTTSTKAFSFFGIPSGIPSNLISPIDYAHGTLYQRVQVISKPSSKTVKYQYCIFQDRIAKEKHACTNEGLLTFTSPGTYYASQSMTSLFQYRNISWGRSLLTQMLVVKDKNGKPVDDRYGWAGTWDGSPNFGLYYPMKVRYTAIIVPPGGGSPIWPSGPSSGSITVVSPNGGDKLIRSTTKTINWSSAGSSGTSVKVELLKGDILDKVIVSTTPNDGSYSWSIPSSQTLGSNYKVRITSTSNSTHKDTSNNNFTIGGINVNSPNGGENWRRGTTRVISWSSLGNPGTYVKIELLKGGVLNRVINSYTPNDGSYSWSIPSSHALGSDYKIKITSTSNSLYKDTSNGNFTISA